MSKKTDKQPMNGNSAPKPAVKNYPAEQHDLDAQQERVRKAAAAGAGTMKVPITASAAPQPASPAAPAKPLVSAAASWPSSAPTRPDAKAAPAAPVAPQKAPVAAKPPAPVSAPKPAPQSAPPTTPVAAVPQKAAAPKTVVTFALAKSGAKKVSVCGEFNGWSPAATPLKLQPDGHWETKLTLAPGQYQYKFIVDEEWIIDPAAQKSVPNAFGSLNSVVEVRT